MNIKCKVFFKNENHRIHTNLEQNIITIHIKHTHLRGQLRRHLRPLMTKSSRNERAYEFHDKILLDWPTVTHISYLRRVLHLVVKKHTNPG